MIFASRIAGIPCLIEVRELSVERPSWDYPGHEHFDAVVLDTRGRPAPWLARKATPTDDARLLTEAMRHATTQA